MFLFLAGLFSPIRASRVITAAFLGLSASSAAIAHEEKPRIATISVSGSGTTAAAPDIATLSLGVVREATTARDALNENTKAMAAVVDAMKAEGIADKDLQTSGFNISPRYHYPKRAKNGEQPAPKIVGYQVSNNLTVRVRDLGKVGEVLDKVITLGVNSGGNIQFSNDDTSKILEQARKKAMENAIRKAKTLTSAAGVGLKRILTISEQSSRPRPVPIAQARSLSVASAAAESVPVQAGENQYRVDVSVSWELSQ